MSDHGMSNISSISFLSGLSSNTVAAADDGEDEESDEDSQPLWAFSPTKLAELSSVAESRIVGAVAVVILLNLVALSLIRPVVNASAGLCVNNIHHAAATQ